MDEIKISTLESLPNSDIEEHFGLVSGYGSNKHSLRSRIKNFYKNFFGGEATDLDLTFEEAHNVAINKIKEAAQKLGANAIVSAKFDCIRLESGCCEVHIYGSAVKVNTY